MRSSHGRSRIASLLWLSAGIGLCAGRLGAQIAGAVVPQPRPGAASAPPEQLPAGPTSDYIVALSAWEFMPVDSSTTTGTALINNVRLLRTITAGMELIASVHLPSGAIIDFIEVDACNTSQSTVLGMSLAECLDDSSGPAPGQCPSLGSVSIPTSSGCGRFVSSAIGHAVSNVDHDYVLDAVWPADPNTALRGVKIHYKLQVSLAPPVASFTDVPTNHPFFTFIEAFYRAGITAGCNAIPLMYCPDRAVTRGELAVLMAKALGLFFPD